MVSIAHYIYFVQEKNFINVALNKNNILFNLFILAILAIYMVLYQYSKNYRKDDNNENCFNQRKQPGS